MKERFTITVDEKTAAWLDKISSDEKIFSSRSHAIEFCVTQLMKLGIEKIVLVRWSRDEVEPLFLSKPDIQTIDQLAKKLGVSREEGARILMYRGLESMKKDMPGSEKEKGDLEDKPQKVIFD
ncbi:ribbon-helix-helix domain-containing protein [Methanosarcina sp. Mfa9]|uniref:ribbon-helix-helix domain-containing protein n=1 Tax=Methanosarcina sp. Mfa9 TaxID=3439063 RepID=UPI003F879660